MSTSTHPTANATTSTAAPVAVRPGDWYAVLGDGVVAVLPPAERARAARVWEVVDAGGSADEVLDLLIGDGLRSLTDLVLLAPAEGRMRVLVRGGARVLLDTVDGPLEVVHDEPTTWQDRYVAGVQGTAVVLDEEADAADGPVDQVVALGGLLRVGRLVSPPRPAAADGVAAAVGGSVAEQVADADVAVLPAPAGDDEQVEPVADAEDPPAPTADPLFDPLPDEEPAEDAEPPEGPEPTEAMAAPQPTGAVPPVPPPWAPAPPVPVVPPAGMPVGSPLSYAPPPPPSYPPPPTEPIDLDHDGMTRAPDWDPAAFSRPQSGIPGQEQAPKVTSRPVATLVLPGGDVVEVDRVVLVGRAPEARRFTSTDQPRLVTVPSPHQEISSTHVEFRPGSGADHGSAVVTDLGSTNGTVLVQPGLPPEALQPGVPVQVLPGAVVDLGDGVTIQVTRP